MRRDPEGRSQFRPLSSVVILSRSSAWRLQSKPRLVHRRKDQYSVNLTMQYEATQRIVDLSHESEDAVGALLMLFYGTELDTGKFDPVGIAKLYQLAHQLDAVNITELIGQNLSTVLKLADETSKTILNDWIKLIEIAYIHMPEHNNVLRSVLVQGMTEWLKEYMFEPDFFGPCFEASGRFAFEVIVLLHAKKIKIW
jgi:hypothetical protein